MMEMVSVPEPAPGLIDQAPTKDGLEKHGNLSQSTVEDDGDNQSIIYPHGIQFALISISICLCVFLVGLDATILTTAIPRITDEFGSVGDVGWYDAAFRLSSCMSQLSQGKLYDNYSVKWAFFVNMVIFEAGILVSGLAPSSNVFILGRAITGLGFSGVSQGCMVMIAVSRPLRQRATYIGFISASEYFAIAVAPLIGGALTSSLSWRWCFFINIPSAAVPAALLLLLKLPDTHRRNMKTHSQKLRDLDLLGCFFFAPAILCLLLALQWGGSTYSWSNVRIIVLFVLAPLVFIAFCIVQHWKQDAAMLPPRILKKRIIMTASLYSLSLSACRAIVQYYLPIWFQTVQGVSPFRSGLNTLPLVVAILVSAVISGWLISVLGSYTPVMVPAGLFVVAGIAIMTTFTTSSPKGLWIPSLILLGIGSGSGVSSPFIAVQTVLDTHDMSVGLAFMTFSQDIGEAVFISIAQAIFLNRLTSSLRQTVPLLDPATIIRLGATGLQDKISAEYITGVTLSYNNAVKSTFYLAVALAGLMVMAGLLTKRNAAQKRN